MKPLSDKIIIAALKDYGVATSVRLCDQIRIYIDLLLRWNQKTSLTTVTDPAEILRFHFGESLLAAELVPIRHGRLADVGSGAGFPAVPIRMVAEALHVILIESNQKKATFLAEIIRELQLQNVEVRRNRMEDVDLQTESVDFVSARALGIDDDFLDWSRNALNQNASIVLWLGDEDSNRISQQARWKWANPFRIPSSDRRVILYGSKI
ncbi:MAG: 16S rRNA (guanine(527)-N(7))-methyltransferase RsmG [Candidatus Acidiferrales bacterium]